MRLSLLSALLLTSCVTSPEPPPPVSEMARTRVCAYLFADTKGIPAAESCPAGTRKVAIGYTVTPIRGECEGAFLSLHGFRQLWGCQP
jgi:hypothetical protein